MRNSISAVVFLNILLAAGRAFADPTIDALTRIEAETAVLKAQVKKLEAQAQIAAKQAEISRMAGVPTVSDPRVRAIEGIGNSLHALVQIESGSTLEVKTGDMLPDGSRVVSIRPNEVIIQKSNKKKVRLLTGVSPASPRELGGSGSHAMSSLPPLSPSMLSPR
ncbi:MAG TPA: type IV pilus biogenesis protein PilP [Noviherbaspirillum sp.]